MRDPIVMTNNKSARVRHGVTTIRKTIYSTFTKKIIIQTM